MSNTLIVYLIIFGYLSYLAIMRKPAWGVSLYIFNLLIFPRLWWWGRHFPIERWSLISGCILLASVWFAYFRKKNTANSTALDIGINDMQLKQRRSNPASIHTVVFFMLLNYTIIHYIIAGDTSISGEVYFLCLKFLLLLFLIKVSIRDSSDFFIIFMTILLCLGYLGLQVWLDNTGDTVHGRLEHLPVPSAQSSNLFASILILFLPSLGALFFVSKRKIVKILIILCFPFILNLIFLVNSRGAYLGVICSAIFLILLTKGKERKIILVATICALIAVPFIAKDEKIFERFSSTFVEEEQRDRSAQSRFLFWQASIDMISDYPYGLGGHAFKKVHGSKYLSRLGYDENRAVHNGYLDIATQWGVQGIFFHVLLIYIIFRKAQKAAKYQLINYDAVHESFFIKACLSGVAGFSISSIFSNTLDEEWLYWMLAILFAYFTLVFRSSSRKIIDF